MRVLLKDRPDSDRFPEYIKGTALVDFPRERWLDIRQLNVIMPIIWSRLDLAKQRAVTLLSLIMWMPISTIRLSLQQLPDQQLNYNKLIAQEARMRVFIGRT
ncbi:MAG: hypothetical protein R2865_15695 [Deinococcales bacterium]